MEILIRALVSIYDDVVVGLHYIVRSVLCLTLISTWDDEVVFEHGSKIMLWGHRGDLMLLGVPVLESGFSGCLCSLTAIVDTFKGSTMGLGFNA